MIYAIRPTTRFQKDLKRIQKRGYDLSLLTDIIKKLASGEQLPEKNRDHNLGGNYSGCRECISHRIGFLYMKLTMGN